MTFHEGDLVLVPAMLGKGNAYTHYAGTIEGKNIGAWVTCKTDAGVVQIHNSRVIPITEKEYFMIRLKGGLSNEERAVFEDTREINVGD